LAERPYASTALWVVLGIVVAFWSTVGLLKKTRSPVLRLGDA
jgi:hypothetical protein